MYFTSAFFLGSFWNVIKIFLYIKLYIFLIKFFIVLWAFIHVINNFYFIYVLSIFQQSLVYVNTFVFICIDKGTLKGIATLSCKVIGDKGHFYFINFYIV